MEPGKRRSLLHDDRGATMVMGIFMAAFVVGMIYYVAGIGQAIVFRESMQDAADSGAFAAAVMHARAMNMIALLNIVIAAVLSVLVALKVALFILEMALAMAIGICFSCTSFCQACADSVELGEGVADLRSHIDSVEPAIESIMDMAKQSAVALRTGTAPSAQVKVRQLGSRTYAPPTEQGFLLPQDGQLPGTLPVEDDPTNLLCDKAAEQARRFVPMALSGYPTNAYVFGMGALVMSQSESVARMFCDADDYAQRVVDGAQMGGDHFQLRAFMIGDPKVDWARSHIKVASWGQNASTYERLEQLSRFSFAQAEFYYNADEPNREEWLWHMNWKARLRRFRKPERWSLANAASACGAAGGANCGILAQLDQIADAVVH